jgi:hypothetical protein
MMLAHDFVSNDRWYLTDGVVAMGPVHFDRLVQGAAHGSIPPGALVRHESWKMWRPLRDVGDLSEEDRRAAVQRLADISARAAARASGPDSVPPPPPSAADLEEAGHCREELPSRPSQRPPAVNPVGVLASAESLDYALLLTLSTSVTAAAATVGLVHCWHDELAATITEYAQGPGAELLLGERLLDDDPSLAAARAGVTVIGEPRLGEAGRFIAGRIGRCIDPPRGVAMIPLHLFGSALAMFEVGREARPFRASEIARVEDVIQALAARIVVAGWLEDA